ncbi:hypothetical protein DsansV1_C49g0244611 [Dioscorea sansibarensis]
MEDEGGVGAASTVVGLIENRARELFLIVWNLEIIDPLHIVLWGSSNEKRSLFHMLKTTKTIGR